MAVWPSAAVKNTSNFFIGIVVLRLMSLVIIPPRVSIPWNFIRKRQYISRKTKVLPSNRGVTLRRSMSLTFPARTPPWIAAPIATASSGLTPEAEIPTKDGLDSVHNLGYTSHTTNKNNLVDFTGLNASIVESLLARVNSALDKRVNQGL